MQKIMLRAEDFGPPAPDKVKILGHTDHHSSSPYLMEDGSVRSYQCIVGAHNRCLGYHRKRYGPKLTPDDPEQRYEDYLCECPCIHTIEYRAKRGYIETEESRIQQGNVERALVYPLP